MADKNFVVKNGLIVGDTATINGVIINPSGATSGQVLKFNGDEFVPESSVDLAGTVYLQTIGDGSTTSFTITHYFGTRDVVVVVRNAASPYEVIDVRWEATTINSITLDFSSAPTSNSVRVGVYSAVDGSTISVGSISGNSINDLGDVTITSVANGQFLKWNGSAWVNDSIPTINTLNDVGDVTITSASNGQFLKWNGTAWVNDSIPTINTLDDVGDVTITSAQNGDLLKWNGSAWVNAAGYALLASPTFTGTVTVPSPSNNTDAANKQYVDAAQSAAQVYADSITVAISDITDGITADASEINILDGATLSTAELNYVDGVTSAIQTQLNAKAPIASPTFTGTATANNLTVSGNLMVSGTTTSINTETLTVDDNIIILNNNATGAPSVDAGIEIERGSSTNVLIRWNETTDKWQFTNDGSTYTDLGIGSASISSTAPTSPVNGQIWFYQDTAQTFVYYGSNWIEIGAVSNGARVEVSSTAPASPATGDLWFDSDTAQTFTYYDSQWIEIGASGMAASVGDSAPASPVNGQIWFDSANASTNVYYDSQWVEVGGGGGSTVSISDSAPSSPTAGALWFNSTSGATFIYYGSVWVEVGVAPFDQLLSTLDAKGDLLVGTANNTVTKLAAGSNNQVLTVDSTTASGLKWSTPTVYQEVVANVSNTEIGYLDGVTSAIQTQLNNKQAVVANVSDTEIGYLDGVTSAIQTQLDTKASTGKSIAMAIVFGG